MQNKAPTGHQWGKFLYMWFVQYVFLPAEQQMVRTSIKYTNSDAVWLS